MVKLVKNEKETAITHLQSELKTARAKCNDLKHSLSENESEDREAQEAIGTNKAYLASLGDPEFVELASSEYRMAYNLTDRFLADLYNKWQGDYLVWETKKGIGNFYGYAEE